MGQEIERRAKSLPLPRGAARELNQVRYDVEMQQVKIGAKTRVAEFAMWEVVDIKTVQRQLEQQQPDAAEALALIANTALHSIARSVAHYCGD